MDMSKAGIFRGDYYSNDFEFIARFSDDNLVGSLKILGRYFVALDESPPQLFVQDVGVEDGELLVSLDSQDFGSGINVHTFITVIDGIEYHGVYDEERDAVVFPMDRIDIGSGIHNVTIQVADKLGNLSEYASAEFELDTTPHTYKLNQNYPNPFNAGTTVKYQIPEPGRVTVFVYSVLGQKISVLVDEYKDAGYYSALWDGRNDQGISVSSGIYICVMKSGTFVRSFKMVFLK
ncbi:T9SS type A sorting domain-containing protein [candidate division KSB1 bacterium]